MSDPLIKNKNKEPSKDDFEPLETDDKPDELTKKNRKSKFIKYLLIFIAIIFIIAIITYYVCCQKSSMILNEENTLLQEYNELGKKDENLKLFPAFEYFLEKSNSKFIIVHIILHFNKDDIDKNRLVEAIRKMVRSQAILQSTFYKENGRYHIKFNPDLYPEIIFEDIKESDYEKYIYDLGYEMDFPINKLMYKFYIITTEKYLYCILIMNHAIYDIYSQSGIVYTLNHTYLNDLDEIQLRKNDLLYASLYEYNLKIKNERNFIKDVQNYYMNNYDLGRTFKNFHKDKDIQTPLKDTVNVYFQMSDKSLKDKIFKYFDGSLSKINYFNMMSQLYTLYLYNQMEDNTPEIGYVRHGRNLTLYRNTIGLLFQISFIKYDFLKNSKKMQDKVYLNVQEFYENVKKQLDEQKFISRYYTSFENYDLINSIPNLSVGQLSLADDANFIPKNIFGKKLLEKTNAGLYYINDQKKSQYFVPHFYQNKYTLNGILNLIIGNADSYKAESLKKISDLAIKVIEILIDGFYRNDKLVEIKSLD